MNIESLNFETTYNLQDGVFDASMSGREQNFGTGMVDIGYVLPKATATTLGGIKVGNNLSIDENGILSVSGYDDRFAQLETRVTNVEAEVEDASLLLSLI